MNILLNKDKKTVHAVRDALRVTGGYCPCSLSHTPDTKCMCKEFREQTEPGYCHCGLYQKIISKIAQS